MKHFIVLILLLTGFATALHAQDKVVLRNGRTIEVKIHRSLDDRIEYTYPGETSIYERPKSAVSYILYQDGREEVCDDGYGSSTRRSSTRSSATPQRRTTANTSRITPNEEIYWQDVRTVTSESAVKNMKRIRRISAVSNTSYKDAIQQLKKKAAAMGGTTILIMDIPEEEYQDIEVMGVAYRDEALEYSRRSANERIEPPQETPSNVRRRKIARQMESYQDDSNLERDDYNTRSNAGRTVRPTAAEPDAVYLMNGRIIKGTIEEFEPDDFVSIRTTNGRVYEYSMDDVKRISRLNKGDNSNKRANTRSNTRNNNYDDGYDSYFDFGENGYKGIFEVGYTHSLGEAEKGRFEVSTTHGYQINQNLFVGVGAGLHFYSARKPEMKTNMGTTTYPQYADGTKGTAMSDGTTLYPTSYQRAIDSSFMMLPVFAEVRVYLPIEGSSFTPFGSVKAGYTFNLSDSFGGAGLYVAPSIGGKIGLTPRLGLIFSLGYVYQGLGDSGQYLNGSTITAKGGYGYYYHDGTLATGSSTEPKLLKTNYVHGLNLKVGIEF